MAATALNICNGALIKLGARTITAFTDTTKEAELCTERYPRLRDKMLRDHTWNFAKINTTLTNDGASELAPRWAYAFSVPPDMARPLRITDVNDFEVLGEFVQGTFHTNAETIILRYVQKFEDTDDGVDFPDDFAEALSNLLAADICVSLTQEQSLRATYYEAYVLSLSQARFNGAIEKLNEAVADDDWAASRNGYLTVDDRSARNLAS